MHSRPSGLSLPMKGTVQSGSPSYPTGVGAPIVLVMPIRNEARDLPATLKSLAEQTIDHQRLRLYLVDGDSDDTTRKIAENWLAENVIAGSVLENPARAIPIALNLGIAQAHPQDIVVRLDGHTLYGPSYLADLIRILEEAPSNVACVGGPQRPISNASFEQRLVATLYSNPMGLGGADHRSGQERKYVTQVYLGAWRPGVLHQLGGFDEHWQANEDSELSARILQEGGLILWAPLDCTYRINRGLCKSIEQWGNYGFWRAQTLRRYPKLAKARHFVAPIALFCALFLAFSPWRITLVFGILAYITAVIWKRSTHDSLLLALAGAFFFPCCQAAWSIGLFCGLLVKPPPREQP